MCILAQSCRYWKVQDWVASGEGLMLFLFVQSRETEGICETEKTCTTMLYWLLMHSIRAKFTWAEKGINTFLRVPFLWVKTFPKGFTSLALLHGGIKVWAGGGDGGGVHALKSTKQKYARGNRQMILYLHVCKYNRHQFWHVGKSAWNRRLLALQAASFL